MPFFKFLVGDMGKRKHEDDSSDSSSSDSSDSEIESSKKGRSEKDKSRKSKKSKKEKKAKKEKKKSSKSDKDRKKDKERKRGKEKEKEKSGKDKHKEKEKDRREKKGEEISSEDIQASRSLVEAMLSKYPESVRDLQFLLFKVDRDEVVVLDGIEDDMIRNSLKKIFTLFRMQRLSLNDGSKAYKRLTSTPMLLDKLDNILHFKPPPPPPAKKKEEEDEAKQEASSGIGPSIGPSVGPSIGPAGPPSPSSTSSAASIGPAMPPPLSSASSDSSSELSAASSAASSDSSSASSVSSSSSARVVGPFMPGPAERAAYLAAAQEESEETEQQAAEEDDDDDYDAFGPRRLDSMSSEEQQRLALLREMREMENMRKELKKDKKGREDWMTILPDEMSIAPPKLDDMKGRTFSMSGVKKRGDTSSWTDTPEEKRMKALERMQTAEMEEKMAKLSAVKAFKHQEQQMKLSANSSPELAEKLSREMLAKSSRAHMDPSRPSLVEMHQQAMAQGTKKAVTLDDLRSQSGPMPLLLDRDRDFSMRRIKTGAEQARAIKEAANLSSMFTFGEERSSFF